MNRLMTTFILSLVVASGCDSGTGEVDVPDGGGKVDVGPVKVDGGADAGEE